MKTVLAFDFGASSGRAIKATFDNNKICCSEIHRFDNIPLETNGKICHDVDLFMNEIRKAITLAGHIDSLAFDTWGVDYGLLDENGRLFAPPFHYRDSRTSDALKKAEKVIPLKDIYAKTGNQIMNINTLFQLISDEHLDEAEKLLFIPDLLIYLLCGKRICEKTIASTSQMLDPLTGSFNGDILKSFGINPAIFVPLTDSATVVGEYEGIKVIAVAGHDTQCAVVAMPCTEADAAFLSCGTWSLIGCELDTPIMTDESFKLELSNELGANGKINFLKNISGLWLIQETRRNYRAMGRDYSYNDLETAARTAEAFRSFIDPDSPLLQSPGNLPDKIREYCKNTGQPVPESPGEICRCIYESLALKYRLAIKQIERCSKKSFSVLHILGGGSKDSFLCQLTADSLSIPVTAGPTEATALGNIILQLIALGEIRDIEEGRKIISENEELKEYFPVQDIAWDEAYTRFLKTTGQEENI